MKHNVEDFIEGLGSATDDQLAAVAKKLSPFIRNAAGGVKYQSEQIVIPNGTGANVAIAKDITLDTQYKRCNGAVCFIIKSQAGIDHQIRILDSNRNYLDRTSHKIISADERTNINERFLQVNIPAGGLKIQVEVKTVSALTQDLVFDVVFRLVDPR